MKKNLAIVTFLLSLSQPLLGQSLEITSEPANCLVAINHRIVGRTPFSLDKLTPGKHTIRVAKGEEFHPYTVEVEVQENVTWKKHVVLNPLTTTHLQRGLTALQAGRLGEGEQSLLLAIQGTPTQPDAHWWLARLNFERGNLDEALRQARLFARVRPTSEVHLLLGDVHLASGRLSDAVTSYKLALLASPTLKRALEGMPKATWETIKSFGQPTDVVEQVRLAYLYELKGLIPEALGWLRYAVAHQFPEWPPTPLGQADTARRASRLTPPEPIDEAPIPNEVLPGQNA